MAKQRTAVQMSDEEIWAFIAEQRDMHVATINKDGTPQLTTNWFAILEGDLVFNSYQTSQKMVNLRRDPRITVIFAGGLFYNELRGVSVKGTVEFADDPVENQRMMQAIQDRNYAYTSIRPENAVSAPASDETEEVKKRLSEKAEQVGNKRVSVRIKPIRFITWDHSKLA